MNASLPNSVNEMKDIIDIEGLFFSSLPTIVKIAVIIVVISLLAAFLLYILKKIARHFAKDKFSHLSPEERAMAYLEALKKKKLIGQKEWRSFYFLLDEIFRRYLTEKFDFDVLDKTFEELKTNMKTYSKLLMKTEFDHLSQFWQRAQMTKFAAQTSSAELAEADFGFVRGIVERTTALKNSKEKSSPL